MIYPTDFISPNLLLKCDTCNWTGTLAISDLVFAQKIDRSVDRHFIILSCGNVSCGSVSMHPIGGGAHPRRIQALFIIKLMQDQGLTFLQAKTVVKNAAENMDYPGRFQWSPASQPSDLSLSGL